MNKKSDYYIVIPAFNESKVIAKVISDVKKEGFKNIIVVDDCSKDNTSKVAKKSGATVARHEVNRGAGAATKTGFDLAKSLSAKFVVTIDADGQHDPKDITRLLPASEKYDVIIGSRMINPKGMPFTRKLFNRVGSLITFILYGIYVRDSQTGFKIFNKKALDKIEINFDRYEFCSEVLHEISRNKLTYKEIPIKVIYTEYSLSKGQNFSNGIRMVFKMIMRLFTR